MSKKSVEFHTKSGDYFSTLAVVLSLARQTSEDGSKYNKILKNIIGDLLYLQRGYKIIKK